LKLKGIIENWGHVNMQPKTRITIEKILKQSYLTIAGDYLGFNTKPTQLIK
jgi:hypothetical protein